MDLGHSPDTGASEGELRSGYALTPSPSHSKNISLFTERRTSERAVSKDGYSSFLFNPLWGFPVVAAGILFVVDHMISRKAELLLAIVLLAFAGCRSSPEEPGTKDALPNFIIVFCDDLG